MRRRFNPAGSEKKDDPWDQFRTNPVPRHIYNQRSSDKTRCPDTLFCLAGLECKYDHPPSELILFHNNGGKGVRKYHIEPCTYSEGCTRRSTCTFAHNQSEYVCMFCGGKGDHLGRHCPTRAAYKNSSTPFDPSRPCDNFVNGKCEDGKNCYAVHVCPRCNTPGISQCPRCRDQYPLSVPPDSKFLLSQVAGNRAVGMASLSNIKRLDQLPSLNGCQQNRHAYLTNNRVSRDLIALSIGRYLNDQDTNSLYNSCINLHNNLKKELDKRNLKRLLEAMLGDDEKTVIQIIQTKRELLSLEPSQLGITEIECKKTWIRYRTEKVFMMALKLKRLDMIKIMYPHMDKLSEIEKAECEKQIEKLSQKNEILQQKYIEEHFVALIKIFSEDNSIAVKYIKNNATKLWEALIINAEEKTTSAIYAFRTLLLPTAAVTIDNYIVDIEQFLIAAMKAFESHCDKSANPKLYFRNDNQKKAYAIWVIGFIQSLLGPDLGKIYCQGIYVASKFQSLSKKAASFKLEEEKDGGRSFYRSSRESHSGLGFNFLCNDTGALVLSAEGLQLREATKSLVHFLAIKYDNLQKFLLNCILQQSQPEEGKQARKC